MTFHKNKSTLKQAPFQKTFYLLKDKQLNEVLK